MVECPDCELAFDSEIELEVHGLFAHDKHWLCEKSKPAIEVKVVTP
jgi:hypothetical protein